MSIRASAILAVEAIKDVLYRRDENSDARAKGAQKTVINSVLIDFYLWDLTKKVELGEDSIDSIRTVYMMPVHRTRSIWY